MMHLPVLVVVPMTGVETPQEAMQLARNMLQLDADLMDSDSREEVWWYVGGIYSGMLVKQLCKNRIAPTSDIPAIMQVELEGFTSRRVKCPCDRGLEGSFCRPDGDHPYDAMILTQEIYDWYIADSVGLYTDEDMENPDGNDAVRVWYELMPYIDNNHKTTLAEYIGKCWIVVVDYHR